MDCQDCLKSPSFFCHCSNSYLCAAHLSIHQASRGNHRYENVPETQNSFRKSMLDNKLKSWISGLKQLKKEIKNHTEATITLLKTSSNSIVNKINSLINQYLDLITKTNFQISQSEEAKNMIDSQININEFSLDDINYQILKAFSVKLFDLINEPFEVERIRKSQFLKNHGRGFKCIVISNDGKSLITGSADTSVRVWNIAIKTQEACFVQHKYQVNCLAISNDDSFVVSGSYDKTLILWDLKNKCSKHAYYGHEGSINTVAVNRNSSLIVSGSDENEIMIWKTHSTDCLKKIITNDSIICGVVFSNFYYAGIGYNVEIFDLISFENIFTIELQDPVRSIAITKNGKYLTTHLYDGSVMIWKTRTKLLYASLLENSEDIKAVLVTSDDENIIIGHRDGLILLWSIRTKEIIHQFNLNGDNFNRYAGFGDFIFSTSYDCDIGIYQISSEIFISFVSLTPFNDRSECTKDELVAYGSGNDVRIYDLNNQQDEIILRGHSEKVAATCISSKMNLLITASQKEENFIIVWDLKEKKLLSFIDTRYCTNCIDISNDEMKAITGGYEGYKGGEGYEGYESYESYESIQSYESYESYESDEGYVILWDLVEFRIMFKFEGHDEHVNSVKFIKDDKFAVSGDDEGILILWNIEEKCMHSRLFGHSYSIQKILVTSDDKYFVSASYDEVGVWEISSEKQVFWFRNLSESQEWLEINKYLEFELSRYYPKKKIR